MKKYNFITVDAFQCPQIYAIGFSDDPQVTHFGPSIRKQYIIHYVLSGKGFFNGNKVESGEGFLITPGTYEEYHSDESDPWAFLWIISEDERMEHFFSCHNADARTGIFKFQNLYEIEAIVRKMQFEENTISSSMILAEMFLHIFNSCVVSKYTSKKPITKLYFDFSVNYIKENLYLPISVCDLCNVIGITQPYLYRIFKQNVDASPKQYILNCKLDEAKRLLVQSELTISQIAASIGFENVLDFSKFFSKQTGTSPTAYRSLSHERKVK